MTISIHDSLYAVFRVGKPQYDLLRFDFQVGVWRDRRLPDRRRLLLLPVLREPAPGEQPDGAERCAGDVQLALRRRQPELRQLLPVQHRPDLHLLHSGGLIQPHLMRQGGVGGGGGGAQTDRSTGFLFNPFDLTLQNASITTKPFTPAPSGVYASLQRVKQTNNQTNKQSLGWRGEV